MTSSSQETPELIHRAAILIKKSHHGVVITGAGISTPSGIPDFRSPGTGLWTHYSPMEVASLTAFRYNPEQFYNWLHPLAVHMLSAQPNPAHVALAELQVSGYLSAIITQNIDGLHARAGATNVLEIHGTLNTLSCINCFKQVSSNGYLQQYIESCAVPHCPNCGSILKPDIILFEEQLPLKIWLMAEDASRSCDLMIIAGTSLEVMPSAKLPLYALDHGASTIIINNTETYVDVRASIIIRGDVADIIPQITKQVLYD
jgi:NAD-dependent deacetylase